MAGHKVTWTNIQGVPSKSFTCGYCGNAIASDRGYSATFLAGQHGGGNLYICHLCTWPTFFDSTGRQTPGVPYGEAVSDISDPSVAVIYDEARRAYSASAYTAAVLCCRKLLMHIAVSKGAKPGESFVSYVDYLASQNYVPPDARPWVDHIRTKGNQANHEIFLASKDDAEELISFSEMLLKLVFEFPAVAARRIKPKA